MSGDEDSDRAAILGRRRRWIALALAGVTSTAAACARPCLTPIDGGMPSRDANTDADRDAGIGHDADADED